MSRQVNLNVFGMTGTAAIQSYHQTQQNIKGQ
jgi:hypothetical protein